MNLVYDNVGQRRPAAHAARLPVPSLVARRADPVRYMVDDIPAAISHAHQFRTEREPHDIVGPAGRRRGIERQGIGVDHRGGDAAPLRYGLPA
jgi:hypothetical protein